MRKELELYYLIDKFRNFLISSNYLVTSRPEYQFRPKTAYSKPSLLMPGIDGFFSSLPPRRQRWIEALDLTSIAIKDYHRVCSRHFPNADASRDPQLNIGRHFASPKKQGDSNKRAKRRESISNSSLSFNSDQDSCDASKTEPVVASYVTSPFHHR